MAYIEIYKRYLVIFRLYELLNDEFISVMHMHGNMQGNKQGCECNKRAGIGGC